MATLDELREKSDNLKLRGKAIKFNDGKEYVISTRLMRGEHARLKEIRELAEKAGKLEEEDLVEFVDIVVRLNYPDVKDCDINADVECMTEVMGQYCGRNIKK